MVFDQREESILFTIIVYPKLVFGARIARNDVPPHIFFTVLVLTPLIGNKLKLSNRGIQNDFFVVIVLGEANSYIESFRCVVHVAKVKIVLV